MNAPKGVEKHVTMHDFPAYADMAKKHVDWWTFRGPADGASHKPTVLTVDPGTVKYAEVDIGRLLSFLWRKISIKPGVMRMEHTTATRHGSVLGYVLAYAYVCRGSRVTIMHRYDDQALSCASSRTCASS